jgi:DNA-binding NarL/FixJ family response regulator
MPKKTSWTNTFEQGSDKYRRTARNEAVHVFIVGDNHIVRSGLRRILESEQTVHVLGDASVKEVDVESLSHRGPNLVLIDLDARGADILGFIGSLHGASEQLPILGMIELSDYELARKALTLGLSGIVLKMQPPAILITAIRELCRACGQNSVPRSWAKEDAQASRGGRTIDPSNDSSTMPKVRSLTARERDIIRLLGVGLKNKEIANRLSISDITVRHHLTSIFLKLEVEDRQNLLILAHRYGLADLSGSGESA